MNQSEWPIAAKIAYQVAKEAHFIEREAREKAEREATYQRDERRSLAAYTGIVERERDAERMAREKAEKVRAWADEAKAAACVRHIKVAAERDALRRWKEAMLMVEAEWDPQEVGKELGIPLGRPIRALILPAIRALREERDELKARMDGSLTRKAP